MRSLLCASLLVLASCNEPASAVPRPAKTWIDDSSPPPLPQRSEVGPLLTALRSKRLATDSLRIWREEPEGTAYALSMSGLDHRDWEGLRRELAPLGFYPLYTTDESEGGELTPLTVGLQATRSGTMSRRAQFEDQMRWVQDLVPAEVIETYQRELAHGWQATRTPPASDWTSCTTYHDQDGLLLLLPTTRPWEAIAWGPSYEHTIPGDAAIQKEWFDAYGAELWHIGFCSLDFVVARPPRDEDEVAILAWEHWAYRLWATHDPEVSVAEICRNIAGATGWHLEWYV